MALTADQIAEVVQGILEAGGIFSSKIPTTQEEVAAYISTDKGHNEVLAFTAALSDPENKLADIPNILDFTAEILHPVLEARAAALAPEAMEVAQEASTKPLKDRILGQLSEAADLKRSSSKTKLDLRSDKQELKEQVRELSKKEWEEFFKMQSANLNILSANFKEMYRQAGIGGAKVSATVTAGCAQFAADCRFYGNEMFKMVKRSAEDAPDVFAKVNEYFQQSVNTMLKSMGTFLHEAKKALDPIRSLHHGIKIQNSTAEKVALMIEHGTEGAKRVILKEAEEKAAQAQMAAIEAGQAKFQASYAATLKKADIDATRKEEDHKDLQDKTGVYDRVKNEVVTKLRATGASAVGNADSAKAQSTPPGSRRGSDAQEL